MNKANPFRGTVFQPMHALKQRTNHHGLKTRATQLATVVLLMVCSIANTQTITQPTVTLAVDKLTDQPDAWFTGEGKTIVDNIVTWQHKSGGWWKAYDLNKPDPEYIQTNGNKSGHDAGFDNGATYSELRILARAYRVTQDEKYKAAFNRGLNFTITAQYPNGGWPQKLPIKASQYSRHITFNDDAMVNVLRLLQDIVTSKPDFSFVSDVDRARAKESFDKGIVCILNCQIKKDGKLTAWCQQHDAQTLAPTNARAYELPSICAGESAGIVSLLMSLPNPDARVRESVDAAVAWFEASKIVGKKYERVRKPGSSKVTDMIFADDPGGIPLWARFYDLETNQPFFCDRDGIKKATVNEIGKERQLGYAWYTSRGNEVIAEYAKWKQRLKTGFVR